MHDLATFFIKKRIRPEQVGTDLQGRDYVVIRFYCKKKGMCVRFYQTKGKLHSIVVSTEFRSGNKWIGEQIQNIKREYNETI